MIRAKVFHPLSQKAQEWAGVPAGGYDGRVNRRRIGSHLLTDKNAGTRKEIKSNKNKENVCLWKDTYQNVQSRLVK